MGNRLHDKLATEGEIHPGEVWVGVIEAGRVLRVIDRHGDRTVEALFYNARDLEERYSSAETLRAQGNVYLCKGSKLRSNAGNPLLSIVADTCGLHDILSGACSAESNTVRQAVEQRSVHNCRDGFLLALARSGLTKRDLSDNVNFFMDARISKDGELHLSDSLMTADRYVELRADMDVLVLLANCPRRDRNDTAAKRAAAPIQVLLPH